MRLHRFYIAQEIGDQKEIAIHSAGLVHQVRRVFRLKMGDSIIIFNGTGFDYECKIDNSNGTPIIDSDSVLRLRVLERSPSRYAPPRRLFLCAAVVKKDTFEWITEKATELGVTDIIPLAAEHSEKKALNVDRLKKISIEASEQSGRDTTPMMHAIMGSGEAAQFIRNEGKKEKGKDDMIQIVVFHTEGEAFKREEFVGTESPLAVFIGPEGGWSPSEIEMFHKLGISLVCLGRQVLRTETAVVAALSMVVFG